MESEREKDSSREISKQFQIRINSKSRHMWASDYVTNNHHNNDIHIHQQYKTFVK